MSISHAPELSIIVPTLNEKDNVVPLVDRIHKSMRAARINYEIVFVDDRSNGGTYEAILELSKEYPVNVHQKVGRRGKAYSIIQGVEASEADLLCMIDADLQYPPEEIAPMIALLKKNHADVVLSNRQSNNTSFIRKFVTAGYHFFFTKLLFGIDYDTQSGLKVFRKKVFNNMELDLSPWSFDLEFILQCLVREYSILTHDIIFGSRYGGVGKINLVNSSLEIGKASIALRFRVSRRAIKSAYEKNVRLDAKAAKAAS